MFLCIQAGHACYVHPDSIMLSLGLIPMDGGAVVVTCRGHAAWQICWVIPNNQKHCYSCYAVMAVHPPMHQKPPNLHRLDKVFYFGVPYSLEQSEGSRGCHNLKPYRHRHYAPEGYSCYTLDKPQGINVLLFLLYCYGCIYKKPHPPGTFKLTQPDKVFYFGVPYTAWINQKVPGEATA